ncbi:cholesterol 24-hydroxylase-like [Asterias amurensis]|uniref:cholesterol 24-hydroxylase-like n=1 Tax=Asterias amurensis TaxID=7602 RepID=UPI003AB1811B
MASISELLVMTFGSVFLVCLIAFVASVLFLHYRHSKYSHIPGPKRRSFFLGNIQDIQEYSEKGKLDEDALKDWGDQFGDVVVVWFLHQCFVFFYDVRAIKDILVAGNRLYSKGWTYNDISKVYGARFLGYGLLTEPDHAMWAKRRDIFNPAFSRSYLKTCISQFNASSDLLVEHLSASADGKKNVHLLDQLSKATIDIIAKVAFGVNFHQFDPEKITSFNKEFNIAMKGLEKQFANPWNKYNPSKTERDYRAKVRHAIGVLRKTGQEIIASQLSALGRGEQLGNNILAFILEASQASSSGTLDMEEMVDEFVTFFLAGQETTANLLALTMLHLCQNPEVMYRLKTEVDAVVSTKEFIPYEDLSKLEYMVAVLKETLRLCPPATGTQRVAHSDCVISNTKIPASTVLGVSFYANGRNAKYWENPLEFIPDRFLHGNESTSGAFTPFSIGPRNCIGQQFALIEARVLLAKLIQHYNFSLVPGQSLGYILETTLKPKDGCQVYLTPVSSNQQ